jgi:hypothetical protein
MNLSRRDFLKLAGGAATSLALAEILHLRLLQPVKVTKPAGVKISRSPLR